MDDLVGQLESLDLEYDDLIDRMKYGQQWIMTADGPRGVRPRQSVNVAPPIADPPIRRYCSVED